MSSKKITIIDYGCGNILNLVRAIKFIGYDVEVTHNKNKIINSTHLILPGVGAFGSAMQEIEKYNNIYTRRIPNFLEIFYEDLINNRDEKLKEVFNYIGVEYDSNNFTPHIPNKMNISRMENVIENYYDLKNKFKDTKYYEFFN